MTAEIAITTLSSKGQVVIPENFRRNWRKGDKILLIRDGERTIMTQASQAVMRFAQDVEFSQRTAAALEAYEKHPESFKKYTSGQFLRKMKEW